MYDGEWNKGVFAGLGTCVWSNGDRYEGQWRDGFAHGVGTYSFATGDVFEGEMHEDKFAGVGLLTTARGWKYRGAWDAGKMHGAGLVLSERGGKAPQRFFRGVPAGGLEPSDEAYTATLVPARSSPSHGPSCGLDGRGAPLRRRLGD